MSEKDKANPRQRITMEQRWEKARRDCAYERCEPAYRFHVAGCERRQQKVQVTNLNTGVTSEATIVHSDARAVKYVLNQHEKQAVKLEPLGEEYWDAFERGEPGARGMHIEERGNRRHPVFVPAAEPAPARPWWKFWGRRG